MHQSVISITNMLTTPSLEDINLAISQRLAASGKLKLELAGAVRECCEMLPLGHTLTVAGRVLKWIKAECIVYGGRNARHDKDYIQCVLLIDGLLLDEPSLEVDLPDDWESNRWVGTFRGPTDGWHVGGVWQDYARACQYKGVEGWEKMPEKRRKLDVCTLACLHEVAAALPAAFAAWQSAQMESVEAGITKTKGATAVLLQHLAASTS